MKYFYFLVVLIACQLIHSQPGNFPITENKEGLSDDDFKKLENGVLLISLSPICQLNVEKATRFAECIGHVFIIKDTSAEEFEKIITENIKLTKFKSVREAVDLFKLCRELQAEQEKEFAEIYNLLYRANGEQLYRLFKADIDSGKYGFRD